MDAVHNSFRDFASFDGAIDRQDLAFVFAHLGWHPSEVDALFKYAPLPDGGRVPYDEFVRWVMRPPQVADLEDQAPAKQRKDVAKYQSNEGQVADLEDQAPAKQRKDVAKYQSNEGTQIDDSESDESDSDSSFDAGSDDELDSEPPPIDCSRRMGVSAEATGAFNGRFVAEVLEKYPFYPKTEEEEETVMQALVTLPFLRNVQKRGIKAVCDCICPKTYAAGERVYARGDFGRNGFIILSGSAVVREHLARTTRKRSVIDPEGLANVRREPDEQIWTQGTFFGMSTMLWGARHEESVYARTDLVVGMLRQHIFYRLVTIHEMEKRTLLQVLLRKVRWFEFLSDDKICRLADVLQRKEFKGDGIIYKEGDPSSAIYLVWDGSCVARRVTADGEEEFLKEYRTGEYFGADCFEDEIQRPNDVVCSRGKCKVMVLTKKVFERMMGKYKHLRKISLRYDPRTVIADWCASRAAFMICRPTSRDAIAKMIDGSAVGKGLNVKGKSSLLNILSGFVPFLQISDNDHKASVEASPEDARIRIYFRSRWARELALRHLTDCMATMEVLEGRVDEILVDDNYVKSDIVHRQVYGLDLLESVIREAYIMRPDIGFRVGWETGRTSEPVLMNMNLHAIRSERTPKVVLYQFDQLDPMNPQGVLVAYAEQFIMPVVSDFDVFLVGMKGWKYEPLDREQQSIAMHMLENAEALMKKPVPGAKWNSSWLKRLEAWEQKGYRPNIPEYGFGDPTSSSLVKEMVDHTLWSGAVRHGPECFNLYFPQELDAEYLILWDGFDAGKRWTYVDESGLREFLSQRLSDAFSFPLNPVWPCRDTGWYKLYKQLSSVDGHAFDSWFPPDSGLREKIEAIHESCPDGYVAPPVVQRPCMAASRGSIRPRRMSACGHAIPMPVEVGEESGPLLERVLRRASFKPTNRMTDEDVRSFENALRKVTSI